MNKKIGFRVLTFINERFPLYTHLLLIFSFYFGTILLFSRINPVNNWFNYKIILGMVNILLIFLQLRVFDEIKDYKTDLVIHPERPLARGLLSLKEAKIIAFIIILFEFAISLFISMFSTVFLLFVIVYSLLMYKEFFVKEFLSKRIFLYAITHTPITGLIILYIFSIYHNIIKFNLSTSFLLIIGFFQAIIFEFSRKTLILEKEKDKMDTYSKKIGFTKATLLVLLIFLITLFFVLYLGVLLKLSLFYLICNISYGILYILITIVFFIIKNKVMMNTFHLLSAFFIVFFNIIAIAEVLWLK